MSTFEVVQTVAFEKKQEPGTITRFEQGLDRSHDGSIKDVIVTAVPKSTHYTVSCQVAADSEEEARTEAQNMVARALLGSGHTRWTAPTTTRSTAR